MAAGPMRIRAASNGTETEVKILMSHDMETGQRKDASGALIPAHHITEITATHNGRVVLAGQFGPAVSKNPYLQFKFKGGVKGDKVSVSWVDNKGEKRTDEVVVS